MEAPESDRAAVAKRAQRQRISTVHETVAEARAAENSKSAPVFSSPSLRFTARERGDVGGWLTGCAARARVWARVERARPLEATCSDGRAVWTGAVRGDGNGRGGLCLSARACWTRPSGPGRRRRRVGSTGLRGYCCCWSFVLLFSCKKCLTPLIFKNI